MEMTRKEWLQFKKILSEFQIPYTVHYDEENKYVDIFITVKNYFDDAKNNCDDLLD